MPDFPSLSSSPSSLGDQFVEERIPIGLPWRILVLSIVLFGFSLFIYFGVEWGYAAYLTKKEKTIDASIQQLGAQVSAEDQEKIVNFYSQLTNLKKVLDRHGFASNFFNFLERNTFGGIYYTSATFSSNGSLLALRGHGASMQSVVEQLTQFDRAPELLKVVADQISFDKDGVSFNVTLTFRSTYFDAPRTLSSSL